MWRIIRHAWGVLRRFYLVHCRPGYVERQLEKRRGECQRCGDCCLIVCRCPFLEGKNQCSIYSSRSMQCRKFPIDERDLRDVPTCAFRFEAEEVGQQKVETGAEGSREEPVAVGSFDA